MKTLPPLVLLPVLALMAAPALAQQSLPQAVNQLQRDVGDLKDKTKTITADRFGDIYTIYNSGGGIALLVEVDKDGGRLSTRNTDGNQVTFLGAGESGAGLVNVNNADGDTVVFLTVDEGGGGVLGTRNSEGTSVTTAGADDSGRGLFGVGNSRGDTMVILSVDDDGGRLTTVNTDGNQTTFIGAGPSGAGLVNVNKPNGDTAVFLDVDERGGLLGTRNNEGTNVTTAGADDSGRGLFGIGNSRGEAMVRLSVDDDGGRIDVENQNGDGAVLIAADRGGQGLVQISGNRVHDTAEVFDLASRAGVVPGSVMAADASGSGALRLAAIAYDRRAVGVVSGAGDFQHGMVIGAREDGTNDLPIALSGQVYVRVTGENGPIAPGDLLVSSSTPGAAMRASDTQLAFGAVIGKALQNYTGGAEGLIRMLVMVR